MQTRWLAEEVWNFGARQADSASVSRPQWTSRARVSNLLPSLAPLPVYCRDPLREERSTSHVTLLGEDSRKLGPGVLWTSPLTPVPSADCARCPCAELRQNCGQDVLSAEPCEFSQGVTPPGRGLGGLNSPSKPAVPLEFFCLDSFFSPSTQ